MFAQTSTQITVFNPEVVEYEAPPLLAAWGVLPGSDDLDRLALWVHLRDQWLAIQESAATRTSYKTGSIQWLRWLASQTVYPWTVTSNHVRGWQTWLTQSGSSQATVNQRLSAVSSWYQFVINEVHMVDGIERSAFEDARGATRANPFKVGNIKRPKITPYGKAAPLHNQTVQKLIAYLKAHKDTLTGSRNYALVFSHLLTASRGSEIVRLRWRDIRPNRERDGEFVFDWAGKGGKNDKKTFPAPAYHLIVAHLKIAGRYLPGHPDHIQDDEFIFVPLVTHGLANLRNAPPSPPPSPLGRGAGGEGRAEGEGVAHLSPKSAQRILQSSLRSAGVDAWAKYRVHDLRHTFAHAHYKENNDILALSKLLNHESIATTQIYLDNMQEPADNYSQGVMRQLGLI